MRKIKFGVVGFLIGFFALLIFMVFVLRRDDVSEILLVSGLTGIFYGLYLAIFKSKTPRASHNYNTSDSMDTLLIGRWVGYPGGDKIEILFNSDGSFDSNMPFGGGSETFGVWRDKDGELLLTVETGQLLFRYSISGSTMNITNLKTNLSLEMSKV